MKILKELQINARASLSELTKRTGLTRQTVAKTINNLKKKKEIWGYTAIFDPKLVGLKPFIILVKADLFKSNKEFIKEVTSMESIRNNEEICGFQTTMHLHGKSDIIVVFLG